MKKHFTLFLILNMFLQFMGCYSLSKISLEELKQNDGSKDIFIKTNKEEFIINRTTTEISSMDWEADDSDSSVSITIKNQISAEDYKKLTIQEYEKAVNKELKIKYNEIESIETEKIDWLKTLILLAGVGIIVLIGIGASAAPGSL